MFYEEVEAAIYEILRIYFKNKPVAGILKRTESNFLSMSVKIRQYNTIIRFQLNRIKFFISLNGKTAKRATKTALAVSSMLITCARSYVRDIRF